jgi:hypothetical protein
MPARKRYRFAIKPMYFVSDVTRLEVVVPALRLRRKSNTTTWRNAVSAETYCNEWTTILLLGDNDGESNKL